MPPQVVPSLTSVTPGSISSYGDRPNTYEEVSEYFRAHFIQTHRRKDVAHRALYTVHLLRHLSVIAV